MDAQRHDKTATDTNFEPDTAAVQAAPRRPTEDRDPWALDDDNLDAATRETQIDLEPLEADAVQDAPRERTYDNFSDDEPGAAFFAGFDHGPMPPVPTRQTIDDEVLEGEEDEDAAPALRIGGWLPDTRIEPSPVPLADSLTTLLPVLAIRPPSELDFDQLADAPSVPAGNLPVPRQRAWLLPGGRNGNLTDDWEPQHKHPRTIRLRYAATAIAAAGVGAFVLYSTVSGAGSPSAAKSPDNSASSTASDSAGGVMVDGSSSASPTSASPSTPGQTKGSATATPSTKGSPLGIGGPSGPPPFSFSIEAEAAELSGSGLSIGSNPHASGGQVVTGILEGQNSISFHVTPTLAGTYHVTLWYADPDQQTVTLIVNTGEGTDTVLPGSPGNGQVVRSVVIEVSLIAGDNTLTWTSTEGTGPDLDRFLIQP